MFGKQTVIPGISDGNPASFEPVSESESFRSELINRQKAEELFRKIETNERLQKCLAQRSYNYNDNIYNKGDEVLFKENDKGRWSGPAKVTGMEGTKVRLVYAGHDRTVPSCRVLPLNDQKSVIDEEIMGTDFEDTHTEASTNPNNVVDVKDSQDIHESNHEVRPRLRRKIMFKLPGDQVWRLGKVIIVGKQKGLERFRCWIVSDNNENSYDFKRDVEAWKYCDVQFDDESISNTDRESKITTEVLYAGVSALKKKEISSTSKDVFITNIPVRYHDEDRIVTAKEDELEKWDRYNAYEEVDFEDQNVLGSRWVVQDRQGKVKARFVVKGCQEEYDPRSDSPTASKESLKLFLSIAANCDMKLKSLDATSAFLQGDPLVRDVYIWPPKERRKEGKIWKLKKSCYGLYDASRKWYLAVKDNLKSIGMKHLSGDEAFFYLVKDGKLCGMILLHVDDFIVAGNANFHETVLSSLENRLT